MPSTQTVAHGQGLGPATYRSLLLDHCSELLAQHRGPNKPDVHEAVAQLLYRWGFTRFFSADDKLLTNEVAAALSQFLPPAPPDPKAAAAAAKAEARATWFGYGSEVAFMKLPPEKRLALEMAADAPRAVMMTAANWYGTGSELAFLALKPEERMARVDTYNASLARPLPVVSAAMPADSKDWSGTDKIAWANAKSDADREAVAVRATGTAKTAKAERERIERENQAFNARSRGYGN